MADTNGGVVIKVKALEFVNWGDAWTARSGTRYQYYIKKVHGRYETSIETYGELQRRNTASTYEEALSQHQAHHEQHVLSMIEGEGV